MMLRRLSIGVFLFLLQVMAAAAQAATGTITITASPDSALIFIDHTMVGKVPLHARVIPGTHEVRISAGEDFVPFVTSVTVAEGQTVQVETALEKTAPALYREAREALAANDLKAARDGFQAAASATGKRPSDIPFYLGVLDERAGDLASAERNYLAWVAVEAGSAVGQYRLGRVREALGRHALAVTAYKTALLSTVSGANEIIRAAGNATQAALSKLEEMSRRPGPDASAARLQLAYVNELRGNLLVARDGYRKLFESLASRLRLHLDDPTPPGPPVALSAPAPARAVSQPVAALYVTSDSRAAVSAAWSALTRTDKTLAGAHRLIGPTRHWIAVQARAFDTASPQTVDLACMNLSRALHTGVLFLQVTADGRAWYFYWNDGHELDQYCSNPGRPGEVDYTTLRTWGGKPEVLVGACRGQALSKTRPAPTITDLNAVIYSYYPEMRSTRPDAWRSPEEIMRTLTQIIGLPCAPARCDASPRTTPP